MGLFPGTEADEASARESDDRLMARYEFKLPDIGEGIAEAEIVAWHVKVGDRVEEDQQLADMMTDKATVEMETPVAGKVVELAGEVGDLVPIGSVLAVIETDGAASAPESKKEVPIADGAEVATPAQEEAMPTAAVEESPPQPVRAERRAEPEVEARSAPAPEKPPSTSPRAKEKVLASPAVRARARDLGIDVAQVKTASDRVRHSDLDAYLLYNGGSVSGRGTASRQ